MQYIIDAFFIKLSDYENLGGDFYINIFLLVVFIALGIGCCFLTIYKNSMYRIVKQFRRHKADSETTAKTLSEVGLQNYYFVKCLLSGDGRITKIVRRVGKIEYSYDDYKALTKYKKIKKEKLNFKEEKFYILPEMSDSAILIENNYYSGAGRIALMIILLVFIYVTLMLVMPELLNQISNIISQ